MAFKFESPSKPNINFSDKTFLKFTSARDNKFEELPVTLILKIVGKLSFYHIGLINKCNSNLNKIVQLFNQQGIFNEFYDKQYEPYTYYVTDRKKNKLVKYHINPPFVKKNKSTEMKNVTKKQKTKNWGFNLEPLQEIAQQCTFDSDLGKKRAESLPFLPPLDTKFNFNY